MEKRFVLAIALSLLVLLTWSQWVSKSYHLDNKDVVTNKEAIESHVSASGSLTPAQSVVKPAVSWKWSLDKFELIFDEARGAISEVVFKDYQNYKFILQSGFVSDEKDYLYQKESSSQRAAVFVYRDAAQKIIKRFDVDNSKYTIELSVEWQNLSATPLKIKPFCTVGVVNVNASKSQSRMDDIAVASNGEVQHVSPHKEGNFSAIDYLAFREKYFCVLLQPKQSDYAGYVKKIAPQEFLIGVSGPESTLAPGKSLTMNYSIYLGPQELSILRAANTNWAAIIHYGTFNVISNLLLQLLRFFYQLVHNWGVAVILLSASVYFVLYPLTLIQLRSTKKMQAMQPKIEGIRTLYKDNPTKMNKEIMDLYRQNKVNPLSGCLPLVLQIPIFFALYQALLRSIVLKGAHFLWIKDLSEPDKLFILPVSLPLLGQNLNLLPVLMALGMFVQQKTSMVSGSGSAAEQQKIMLILFPIMFCFIFYNMPSGLVLYWFVNSLLMLTFQLRMNKKIA